MYGYVTRTLEAIRSDCPLYVFIVVYAIFGLAFVWAVGTGEGAAAYGLYLEQWTIAFLVVMPTIAIATELFLVIHRIDDRRRLAFRRAFSPYRVARFASGLCLMMALMVFQGTFTLVKNALPEWRGGFPYDRIQASVDAWLHFGVDPWQPLYAVAGNDFVRGLVEWNYNVLWFLVCFGVLFFVLTSPKAERIRTRYALCFMLTWIVCGNILAGLFLSAGPAFYGAVTGDEARFAEQLAFLARSGDSPHSAVSYQDYLWRMYESGRAGVATGISAFPSVHVAVIVLNALFAWEFSRKVGLAMFAYLVFMIASSVYLAWHYAIDGYASVAIVVAIYVLTRRFMAEGSRFHSGARARRPAPAAAGELTAS